MITTLLFLAQLISPIWMPASQLAPSDYESLDSDIIYLFGDTTSFNDSVSIVAGSIYASVFSPKIDQDYYCFAPSSSGIYSFSVINGTNASVTVYGKATGSTPIQITSYVVNSNEDNFGYNHGVFLDTGLYDCFFFVANSGMISQNLSYFLSVNELEMHGSNFDLFRYDVSSCTYSSLAFSYTGTGQTFTSGYNPNGSASITLGIQSTGTDVNMTMDSGINTLQTYPYSAIGANGLGHASTSFLIGSNIVATAMHCVGNLFCINPNIASERVYFGSNQKYVSTTYGSYTAIYFSPHYFDQDGNQYKYDWAFGVLDDDYGNNFGYLPIAKAQSYSLSPTSQIVIDGYKGGQDYQVLSYANYISTNGEEIRYSHVTAGGDSGAPAISFTHGKVFAIHTGSYGNQYSAGIYFNSYRFGLAEQLIGGILS